MTHTPKTMSEIRDEAATDWCIEMGVYNKEHFAFQAGFDCRDRLDNEALKVAVEVLEECNNFCQDQKARANQAINTVCSNEECDFQCDGCLRSIDDCESTSVRVKSALAKIRELRGEG